VRHHRIYQALFLIALTALLVEVLLTRIFDVILWPNFSFMIISSAMFGVGLGGLFEVLRPVPDGANPAASLSRTALLFAITVWALPLLLNTIPFSVKRIGQDPLAQSLWFLVLYLVLLAPFFLAGLFICRLFASSPGTIRKLYFWDLSGAAVGTTVLIPLLPWLGPERLLLVTAIAALGAVALLSTTKRARLAVTTAAIAFVAIPIWCGDRYLTLALHENKRQVRTAIELGRLEFSRWDPVSQISVVDQPVRRNVPGYIGRKHVAYDGGTQSTDFFPFDGNVAALRRDLPQRLRQQFWQRGVLAAHYLRRDSGHTALIIGSAGGQETKAALMYGASDIDTVEMVGTVVDLATGPYADYIGGIFQRPEVHPHVGEGRSFLRASSKTYDVIQVFSNYTSSSAASGSGALTPVYLLTSEAFTEYFSHLSPNGILQINHHTYPRMISTAAAAWQGMDRADFRSHVAVIERQMPKTAPDYLPTLLIKMSPWSAREVADLKGFITLRADGEPPFALVENPLDPASSFLPDRFYAGQLSGKALTTPGYNVDSVSDDRPYFNFMHRSWLRLTPDRETGLNASTASFLNAQLRGGWIPSGWLHLIVTSIAGIVYGLLFVLVPLSMSRVGRETWPGKSSALIYFSLLGVSFIAIEILFIQIFMKLIGFPLYSVATVLTVTLVGAGLGSMTSDRIAGENSSRWPIPFIGIVLVGLIVWATYADVSARFMSEPMVVRIAAASAMILPMAFFMGMPFPMGMLELASKPRGAIAWAWSMNGLFSTIGGGLTVMLSLWLGFHATLLVALGIYASAVPVLVLLRRSKHAPATAIEGRVVPLGFIDALWRAAGLPTAADR
jgi:hypothetical protein